MTVHFSFASVTSSSVGSDQDKEEHLPFADGFLEDDNPPEEY